MRMNSHSFYNKITTPPPSASKGNKNFHRIPSRGHFHESAPVYWFITYVDKIIGNLSKWCSCVRFSYQTFHQVNYKNIIHSCTTNQIYIATVYREIFASGFFCPFRPPCLKANLRLFQWLKLPLCKLTQLRLDEFKTWRNRFQYWRRAKITRSKKKLYTVFWVMSVYI